MAMLAENCSLRAEAAAALPALRAAACLPAGERGVMEIVGSRFALYPQPDRSDAEWSAWWANYFATVAELPHSAVEAAMAAWVMLPTSEFLPKPGRLRELALTTPNKAATAYTRARLGTASSANRDDFIPDGAELVRKTMAEFLSAKTERERELSTKPGAFQFRAKVDDGGLTPEMRALLAGGRAG